MGDERCERKNDYQSIKNHNYLGGIRDSVAVKQALFHDFEYKIAE